jgi:hypothetical protein
VGQILVQIMRQSGSVFGANQHGAICMQIAPCESDNFEIYQGLDRADLYDDFLGIGILFLHIRLGGNRPEQLTHDANIPPSY